MPLQIEHNSLSQKQFELKEVRVIACSEQGEHYGEVCPDCIAKGFNWIKNRFLQLFESPKKFIYNSWDKKADKLIEA